MVTLLDLVSVLSDCIESEIFSSWVLLEVSIEFSDSLLFLGDESEISFTDLVTSDEFDCWEKDLVLLGGEGGVSLLNLRYWERTALQTEHLYSPFSIKTTPSPTSSFGFS